MGENYMYFGLGIVAVMLVAGLAVTSQTMQAKEFEGSTASITLSIEEGNGNVEAYFSELPAERLFSEATTVNFSSETEPGKTVKCEFTCTK